MPVQLFAGILLMSAFWYFNWALNGLRTHWGFFPLWLGYCLTMDGLVYLRKGTSLIDRNKRLFFLLFVLSSPVWWLFEFMDAYTNYWQYLGRACFSDLEFFALASLSFSTVIPAVFTTTELTGTFSWVKKCTNGPKVAPTCFVLVSFFVLGIGMLATLFVWPGIFVPFLWMALYFLLEPINYLKGKPTLLQYTQYGDWRPVIALWSAALICGFFWEMWNIYSYPKWVYQLPWLSEPKLFEMPLAGYLGYLPFSLELYAFYALVFGEAKRTDVRHYLQVVD